MTVPPPAVKEFDDASLEKIAYNSVSTIPTKEMNDRYRLGFHVWSFLKEKKGTVAEAVKRSGARILISEHEAVEIITAELNKSSAQ